MAIQQEVGNIFFSVFGNTIFIVIVGVVILFWFPIFLYLIKYNKRIEIEEQIGDGTQNWYTKGAIIYNKKRNREELHILKNKFLALPALFSNKFVWERPPLPNKYHHKTNKGKSFYKFYKIGENSADLHPIPPTKPTNTVIKPVDEKIHSWLAQGLKEDARETRKEQDGWQKFASVGAPIITMSLLLASMIFTYDYGNDVLDTQERVTQVQSESINKLNDIYRSELGVQTVPGENNTESDRANEILKRGGIDLT